MKPDTPENALAEAVRLLSRRNLSEAQLRSKLTASFPENCESAIARMRERGLIRDSSVVDQLLARAIKEGRGNEWLEHELARAGLNIETLPGETDRAWVALRKKGDMDAMQIGRYLGNRGFTVECIAAIIEELYDA